MADDDQQKNQDEYQFADLDVLGTEQDTAASPDDEFVDDVEEGVSSPPGRGRLDNLDPKVVDTLRKGGIAIVALLLVLITYKSVTGFFTSKTQEKSTASVASTVVNKSVSKTPIPASRPITTNNNLLNASDNNTTAGVASLKKNQTQIESELSNIQTQVSTVTQNMSDLSAKMADVQQTMLVLSERLEQQSQQMVRVQTMSRSRRVTSSKPSPRSKQAAPKPVYFIQAIIPGRAWLMSSDGSSLTVSRGSPVPGYGAVRLVNAKVGRVFTSSGRVIKFSQADS
jgi:intracellular multiplication protein IcmG